MKTSDFFRSQALKIILIIIGVVVIFLVTFSMGEHIGFHKASFTFQNGDNFYHTFGPNSASQDMLQSTEFSNTHGVVGKVINITLPTLTIEDRDNTEKTVLINNQTIIRQLRKTLTPSDIKVGDYIVAIGEPNAQSQIAAVLIRELPPPTVPTASGAQQ